MSAERGPMGTNTGLECYGAGAEETGRSRLTVPFANHPQRVVGAGDTPSTAFTPALLARAFIRRWKPILFLGTVGAASAIAAVLLLVPSAKAKYATYALIRVEPGETLPGSPQARTELRDLRTQAELIKTPFVIRAALQTAPASELPAVRADLDAVVNRVCADLRAEAVSPQILRITLTGSDPDELPVIVDAIKETYLHDVVQGDRTRRVKRKEFLELAYRDCEKRLTEKRQGVADPALNAPEQTDEKLALERFTLLQTELFRIEMDLHRSRLELALAARPNGETTVPGAVVEELAEKDPLTRQSRAQLVVIDARIAHWELVAATPGVHEPYNEARSKRATLAGEIEARKQLLLSQYTAAAAEEQRKRAGLAKERTTKLEDEETLTRTLIARGWDEYKRSAKGSHESRLRRYEVERLEAIAKQILDELEGLRLEGGVLARTAAVQDAAEPAVKAASRQPMRLLLAGLVPFLLVGAVVLIWELRAHRIYDPSDVRTGLGLRVLGAIPDPARCPAAPADAPGLWLDSVAQSADAIAAVLHSDLGPSASRVIVVTSAGPGEGKSTFARLLAAAAARAGHRTVLLDGDLYRPTVHRAFAIPPCPGLGGVLSGAATVAEATRPTATENLFIMPAGAVDDRAAGRLVCGGVAPILSELRSAFDLIVIDSGPVLATSHPLLIARHADAVVLTVLSGVSRLLLVHDAISRLANLRLPVAGLVVNGSGRVSRYGYTDRTCAQDTRPAHTPAL